MHMKKALATLGAALLVSQGASAITIINTDSTVSASGSSSQGNRDGVGVEPAGLPPLPGSAGQGAGASVAVATPATPTNSGLQAASVGPTNETIEPATSMDTDLADKGEDEIAKTPKPLANQGTKAVSNATTSPYQFEATEIEYLINEGWLSDSLSMIADRAGYELKWEVGEEGKADYRIHRKFPLRAVSAHAALADLIEPYPIRICMYERDRIARAVAEGRECY